MEIEIKELYSFKEFEEISQLQKSIWNLSDRDTISTITLKALTMSYPLMGIILGAYFNNQIIGFAICLPTREPNTLYGLIMGVLPEYRNKEIGNRLGLRIHEICKRTNISKICWTYEPLDLVLGNLYLNKWGGVVVKYEKDYYQLQNDINETLPLDRFIVDCQILSSRVLDKIKNKFKARSLVNALNEYPIAKKNYFPDEKSILVEIPYSFQFMKKNNLDEIIEYRLATRTIFEEYINNRSYYIAELLSGEVSGEKKFFYLLDNRSYL